MSNNTSQLLKLWQKNYCAQIEEYEKCAVSQQLKQMASLFSPGKFYYYIVNFHNMNLDYVHPGTEEVLGISPEKFTIEKLLNQFSPQEYDMVEKKESVIADFRYNFLDPQEMPYYKVLHFLHIKDTDNNLHTILHQSTPLSVSEDGRLKHVIGVHTDISQLSLAKNNKLSFVHLNGGESYWNIDPEDGTFDPEKSNPNKEIITRVLTDKEIQITQLLSKGYTAKEISKKLYISFNTVRTHRKNILKKTNCANTAELVAKCVIEGLI